MRAVISNGFKNTVYVMVVLSIFCIFLFSASSAIAADGGFVGACNKVTAFFKNFETILKVASISIVTIAVVFAGYQIAFAHKRLSDVAPILIGGLLIGGAATIAGWFVADWKDDQTAGAAKNTCVAN